jgi:hypothetical protein
MFLIFTIENTFCHKTVIAIESISKEVDMKFKVYREGNIVIDNKQQSQRVYR